MDVYALSKPSPLSPCLSFWCLSIFYRAGGPFQYSMYNTPTLAYCLPNGTRISLSRVTSGEAHYDHSLYFSTHHTLFFCSYLAIWSSLPKLPNYSFTIQI